MHGVFCSVCHGLNRYVFLCWAMVQPSRYMGRFVNFLTRIFFEFDRFDFYYFSVLLKRFVN